MIQIHQLKLAVNHTEADLKAKILKTLRLKEDALLSYSIKKQSLDARKKPELYYVYSIEATVSDETALKRRIKNKNVQFLKSKPPYQCRATGSLPLTHRPVIIGMGPAGLFCAYQLSCLGYRPVLLERGACAEERLKDVEAFWETGVLNPDSNVQFGEGGAGTFSDGKLNTLVHDREGRGRRVLEIFVEHGAPKEILYQNKPHIGTDILTTVVKNIRQSILANGGEVRFHSMVTDIVTEQDEVKNEEKLRALKVLDLRTQESYLLPADAAIFAIGHSARDTFRMLERRSVPMEAKAFAVGVRIEHPQEMIDTAQYGRTSRGLLPPAAYKLSHTLPDGRGVYTFCMCPGGYVVNASSEAGRLAVNGMSYHDRGGRNANSAVIVTVTPEDYGSSEALAGMEFQQRLEEAAYREGNGRIPTQLFEDFCKNRATKQGGSIDPQMKGAFQWGNVRKIFPERIAASIEEGIRNFDKKLPGYSRPDAVLSGAESRTSSPVRILRDESLQSALKGLYPCGEGAGYAGGITSAAMDGLKVSETIAKNYRPFDTDTKD